MKLIIGGTAQGKTDFAYTFLKADKKNIVNNLHVLIQDNMRNGIHSFEEILAIVIAITEENPDTVFIGNEIGCGIVPLEAFERDYRDMVGHIYCYIAKNSTHVYRVICGIGTCIKGE